MSIINPNFDHNSRQRIIADCKGYDVAGIIYVELLNSITAAPRLESKTLYIEEALEKLFINYDWTRSFTRPQIIVYDELMPSEILIAIHGWLRKKSADIENISLAVTNHIGVSKWWAKWCNTFNEKSFKIIEFGSPNAIIPHWERWTENEIKLTKSTLIKQKQFTKFFNFYGGKIPRPETQYFMLKVLDIAEYGIIDYLGEMAPIDEIIAYAESITYYKNQEEINKLLNLYTQNVSNNQLKDFSQGFRPILHKNTRLDQSLLALWDIDRQCFCTIVREVLQSDVYPCFTEKTFRALTTHLTIVPAGYNVVQELENLGYWFPHEIIDYSYSTIPNYAQRITALIDSIKLTINKFSLNDLQQFYIENFDHYYSNANLALKYSSLQPQT